MSDALWAARMGDALAHTSMMADIRFGYDARGNLQVITDALGERTLFSYDAHGRRVQFGYDRYGRLQALINENGERYRFAWMPGID